MRDPHENIFYYYAGSSSRDRDRNIQIENNTTKALINVLMHSSPKVVKDFLHWIDCDIDAEGASSFRLQADTIEGIRYKKNRILLGLAPGVQEKADVQNKTLETNDDETMGSRPDAWIWGEDYIVAIENKVVGGLNENQLKRHLEKLKLPGKDSPFCIRKTWAEVYRLFFDMKMLKETDCFLVGQLTEYLEFVGLADFTGFKKEFFERLCHMEQECLDSQIIKRMVTLMADRLLPKLTNIRSFYSCYHVGNIKRGEPYSWVAFGPGGYKDFTHQTVSVDCDGVRVFVNTELKKPVDKLVKLLGKQEGQNKFRNAISIIEKIEPLRAIVLQREQLQASSYDSKILDTL
jgi:hypothetical protein